LPRASICCSPPDSDACGLVAALGQPRERLEGLFDPAVDRGAIAAEGVPEDPQVVDDAHRREDRLAPRDLRDAQGHPLLGTDVGDVGATEVHGASRRQSEAGDARSSVDLPAPFVPSSATISPSSTVKFASNRTCSWP
jgi:hypothetical protein